MSILFITGTSTDVGKTVVTAAIAALADDAGMSVRVAKPIQTGVTADEPGDLQRIEALSGCTDTHEYLRLPDPMAPEQAARRAGVELPTGDELVDWIAGLDGSLARGRELEASSAGGGERSAAEGREPLMLVEGAGGLLVRLGSDGTTLLDLAARLAAPVVVVTTAGLGTLNHTELTTRTIAATGVDCVGLVIGSWPVRAEAVELHNRCDLPLLTGVPLYGALPAGIGDLPTPEFAAEVRRNLDPVFRPSSSARKAVGAPRRIG